MFISYVICNSYIYSTSGVPRNFVRVGSANSVKDRGLGAVASWSGGWRRLYFRTRDFISYSKIFLIFGTLRLFMITTNLFLIVIVKQLRTDGSFRI